MMTDFQALYDEKEEYVARRDQDSCFAKRVAIEVNHYKIPLLTQVLPQPRNFQSIAEIGCGTGEIIAGILPDCDARRVGFDISPLNIEAASKRFPQVEFSAEPFEDFGERFDLMILSDVIEHVPDDVGFLRSAAAISDSLVINLPLEKCWKYRSREYGPDDSSGHLRSYSVSDGLDLIQAAGLEVIDWTQRWPLEEPQEQLRQELNVEETGHRFSGSFLARQAKKIGFMVFTGIKPIGRKIFPSNLFASVRHPTRHAK